MPHFPRKEKAANAAQSDVAEHLADSLCEACKSVNLCLEDFWEEREGAPKTSESRLVVPFRTVFIGTFGEVRSRINCPLCRLAVTTETHELERFAKSKERLANQILDSKQVIIQLGFLTPRGVGGLHLERAPVVLYLSNTYDCRTLFTPLATDMVVAGGFTPQYFTRDTRDVEAKCALIQQWVKTCETGHGSYCRWHDNSHISPANPTSLLLIDVVDGCIVEGSHGDRYVALSYVWGSKPFFMLTKSNMLELRRPGSLSVWGQLIPKTLRDSITVIRSAGERYLWVDSLCIPQDDGDAKHDTLSAMHSIYGSAVFVIIALTEKTQIVDCSLRMELFKFQKKSRPA